jgi:two-component system, LytTR family, response regulator AlgR
MNVLIVDDEPLARQRLARLLAQLNGYQVVAEAQNGEQAIASYEEHHPDVILMDIRMPVMDGLNAARYMAESEQPPALIFCTAYDDYALEAFDANAVDYLLKPVNRDKLAQALGKAQKLNRVQLSALVDSTDDATPPELRSHICAKSSRGVELVPLDDIRYFLADQKYVTVYHLSNGEVCETLIDDSLKDLEHEFGSRFVRVHRNALVAISHIQGLERTEEGTRVKLAGVDWGPQISRRHMPAVRQMLQNL